MQPYSEVEHETDKERILTALDAINALRNEYKDVLVIPEVVTLHDVTEYRVDTISGPKQFKTIYNRTVAVAVLQAFAGTDYIAPEQFEFTVNCALAEVVKERKR
jgi:hypothetical protein